MLIIWPPQLPLPPLPPSSPTTITTMSAHYDINVMSIFVEMGGFENQTAMWLKPSHSWHPCGVSFWWDAGLFKGGIEAREKEGCSWRKWKARTQKYKPEMKQTQKKPNRATDLKENKRNGRKTWNKKQFSVNCTQRKRLKWKMGWKLLRVSELTPHGEQLRGAAHHGQLSLAEDESPALSTGVFN